MAQLLLENYCIDADYLYDTLKNYILPHHRVAVVALSFNDLKVKNEEDWQQLYDSNKGKYYDGIVRSFESYGVSEQQVQFINYFNDSEKEAKEKIRKADILYFLGGLPDRMMKRILKMDLYDVICQHQGLYMGYSAGALIQLKEYHLSPDKDYPEFVYFHGLPLLDDFYLEVHYENTKIQNEAIQRVLKERKKTVYATVDQQGAILVEHGNVQLLGKVKVFE